MPSQQKTYDETVNYLYALQYHGIKLGLENPVSLMRLLGEPHRSFRSVHIAGTNGKGSTAAVTAAILEKSGYRVGLFTSPHLVSFTERMKINGSPISESEVIRLASHIRSLITGDLNPTFFEFVTAMAFCHFASEGIDCAVVEVGMGGRLDATNVLTPEVSVITNISHDHREFLGESIEDIAREKAGIIKAGIPVVTAVSRPEALRVLEKSAQDLSSELHLYQRDFKSSLVSMDDKGIVFNYSGSPYGSELRGLSLNLRGKHQMLNAALALRTCEILSRGGLAIEEETLRAGLPDVDCPGRLELVSGSPAIYIDSAHNPEAACSLAAVIKESFPGKQIILVAGIMKDKDIRGILEPLAQIADSVVLTKPGSDRAASAQELKKTIDSLADRPGQDRISMTASTAEALELAKNLCQSDNIILVSGSFYTTGEVKELLGARGGALSSLREEYRMGKKT